MIGAGDGHGAFDLDPGYAAHDLLLESAPLALRAGEPDVLTAGIFAWDTSAEDVLEPREPLPSALAGELYYYPFEVRWLDLDNDGDLDAATRTQLFLAGADGEMSAGYSFTGSVPERDDVIADLDGDGFLDIAATIEHDSTLPTAEAFFNDGHGGFDRRTGLDMQHVWGVGDVDGDGSVDIIGYRVTEEAGKGILSLRRGVASGGFEAPSDVVIKDNSIERAPALGNFSITPAFTGDVDGDGDDDFLMWGNVTSNASVPLLFVHWETDRLEFDETGFVAAADAWSIELQQAGDFDGDGDIDVLLRTRRQLMADLFSFGWNRDGRHFAEALVPDGELSYASISVGNWDDDGVIDLLRSESDTVFVKRGRCGESPE